MFGEKQLILSFYSYFSLYFQIKELFFAYKEPIQMKFS